MNVRKMKGRRIRKHTVGVRLNDREKKIIDAAADAKLLPTSEWLRTVALVAAGDAEAK